MSHSKDKERALDELRILQGIVARHDDISFKIKGWCVTLITGIMLALKSGNFAVSTKSSLILAFGISLLFLWVDVVYRVAEDRAIDRSDEIEKLMRDESEYDGPKIVMTLRKPNTLSDQYKSLKNVRIYLPYLILTMIVIIVSIIK